MKKEIHKFVDCEDGWTAEIIAIVDNETGEVLEEEIVMSHRIFHGKQKFKED